MASVAKDRRTIRRLQTGQAETEFCAALPDTCSIQSVYLLCAKTRPSVLGLCIVLVPNDGAGLHVWGSRMSAWDGWQWGDHSEEAGRGKESRSSHRTASSNCLLGLSFDARSTGPVVPGVARCHTALMLTATCSRSVCARHYICLSAC